MPIQIHENMSNSEFTGWWMEHALDWIDLFISSNRPKLAGRWAKALAHEGHLLLSKEKHHA